MRLFLHVLDIDIMRVPGVGRGGVSLYACVCACACACACVCVCVRVCMCFLYIFRTEGRTFLQPQNPPQLWKCKDSYVQSLKALKLDWKEGFTNTQAVVG